jgi:CRP-like cAMP-binding protein
VLGLTLGASELLTQCQVDFAALVISPGQPVRLRTDFPDTAKSRRIYFRSRGLNVSDAAVFEFILSQTVNADGHKAAAELSHNQIAAATGLSRRTVIRSIERLEKAALIETMKHKEWHRGSLCFLIAAP